MPTNADKHPASTIGDLAIVSLSAGHALVGAGCGFAACRPMDGCPAHRRDCRLDGDPHDGSLVASRIVRDDAVAESRSGTNRQPTGAGEGVAVDPPRRARSRLRLRTGAGPPRGWWSSGVRAVRPSVAAGLRRNADAGGPCPWSRGLEVSLLRGTRRFADVDEISRVEIGPGLDPHFRRGHHVMSLTCGSVGNLLWC